MRSAFFLLCPLAIVAALVAARPTPVKLKETYPIHDENDNVVGHSDREGNTLKAVAITFDPLTGKVLLVSGRHGRGNKALIFPRGHYENRREDGRRATAVRELREETGYIGEEVPRSGHYREIDSDKSDNLKAYILRKTGYKEEDWQDKERLSFWLPIDQVAGHLDGSMLDIWNQAKKEVRKYSELGAASFGASSSFSSHGSHSGRSYTGYGSD